MLLHVILSEHTSKIFAYKIHHLHGYIYRVSLLRIAFQQLSNTLVLDISSSQNNFKKLCHLLKINNKGS